MCTKGERYCRSVEESGGPRARPPLENAVGSGTRVDAEGGCGDACGEDGRGIALEDMYGRESMRWGTSSISVQVGEADSSW